MKMKSNSFKDAVELAEAIFDELYPHQSSALWTVINVAKHKDKTFLVAEDSEISLSYGYNFDETIEILRDYGVFEVGEKGKWFIRFLDKSDRFDKPNTGIITDEDTINREGVKLGYVTNEYSYYHDDKYKTEGLYAVLVNVKLLNKFISSVEKLLNTRDYWYENGQLKFLLVDGEIDQIDFSNAKQSREIFETFYALWKSNGVGEYTNQEIASKYKSLFKSDLLTGKLGEKVANIRQTMLNKKTSINNRIQWEFNKKKQTWIFKISPRNPLSY